jgi:hypothetical protein
MLYQKKNDIFVIALGSEDPGDHMDHQNVQHFGFVISESLQGRHILFNTKMIHRSLSQDLGRYRAASPQKQLVVKTALDLLLKMPSLEEKRLFISSLSDDVQNLLIYFYFQFLDKFMQELNPTIH